MDGDLHKPGYEIAHGVVIGNREIGNGMIERRFGRMIFLIFGKTVFIIIADDAQMRDVKARRFQAIDFIGEPAIRNEHIIPRIAEQG